MATFMLNDASAVINSVDLSDHITSITLDVSADALDDTHMGDSWRGKIGGMKDFNVSIEFSQDFAASEVDATMWAALGTVVSFVGKPTSASVGATNPTFTGNVLLTSYSPISGGVGDKASTSVSLEGAGTLTRATS